MSRSASDWDLVGESSDPIPGDPWEMAGIGAELRETADSIARQAREIDRVNDAETWDSEAAKEFRNQSGDTSDRLMKAYARYDAAADALGTAVADLGTEVCHSTYASELHRAQLIADKALRDARVARSELDAATHAIGNLPDDVEDDDIELVRLENDEETARTDITACAAEVQRAKEIRDNAVDRLVGAIEDVIDNSAYKDGFWDRVSGVLGSIAKIAGLVAMVAGIAALAVGWIPVIGQVLAAALGAVALVAGVVSLLANTALALSGHGSWKSVALDAIGVATFGIGRAAIAGARAANTGLRAMGRSGIARQTGNYNRANRLTNSPRGRDHRAALDNMPRRPVLDNLREGFSPKQMYRDTRDAIRNPLGGGGGPRPGSPSQLDPEVARMAHGIRNLDPQVLAQPGVTQGVQIFNQNAVAWTAANAAGTAAATEGNFGPVESLVSR